MWSMVFCLFGIHWVMLHKVIEMFDCWPGLCLIVCVEDYQMSFLPYSHWAQSSFAPSVLE